MSNTANPWAAHAGYISVGPLRNILSIAKGKQEDRISGFLKDSSNYSFSEADEIQDSNEIAASVQQIHLLKKVCELDEELNKLQKESNRQTLMRSTADITDCHSLEALLRLVEDMCHHLQNIIHNKGTLISHCQEAHEDHMTLDAEYHSDMVECFPLIAKQLGQLTGCLDSIRWTNQLSINDSNVTSNCKKLASRLAMVQSFYQTLEQGRTLMRKRIRKHHELTN